MAAKPTTTVGEVMSLVQGAMSDPRVSNSIARLIRQSKQHKDIAQGLMQELQSGVLGGGKGSVAAGQSQRLAQHHAQMANFFTNQAKIRGVEAASAAAGPGALGAAAISAGGAFIGKAIDAGVFDSETTMGTTDEMGLNLAELQGLELSDADLASMEGYDSSDPMGLNKDYGSTVLPETMRMQPTREVSPVGMSTAVEPSLVDPGYSPPMFDSRRFPGGQSRNMPAAPATPVAPVAPAAPETDSLGIGNFSPGSFNYPDSLDLSLPQKREMPAPSYASTEMAKRAALQKEMDEYLEPRSPQVSSALSNVQSKQDIKKLNEYLKRLYGNLGGGVK